MNIGRNRVLVIVYIAIPLVLANVLSFLYGRSINLLVQTPSIYVLLFLFSHIATYLYLFAGVLALCLNKRFVAICLFLIVPVLWFFPVLVPRIQTADELFLFHAKSFFSESELLLNRDVLYQYLKDIRDDDWSEANKKLGTLDLDLPKIGSKHGWLNVINLNGGFVVTIYWSLYPNAPHRAGLLFAHSEYSTDAIPVRNIRTSSVEGVFFYSCNR